MNKLPFVLLTICCLLAGCREEEPAPVLPSVRFVNVVIPFRFLTPEPATGGEGNTIRSAGEAGEPQHDFKIYTTGNREEGPATRALTSFRNTWVLTFAPDGSCLSCGNAGEVSPETPVTASLPTGNNLTLYILANGPAALAKPATLADFEGAGYFSTTVYADGSEVPYIGKTEGVNVDEKGRLFNDAGTDVRVPLKRIAAKLSVTCTVAVADYDIESVRLYNAPVRMFYVYSNTAALITADTLAPANVSGDTYTWFIGENLRGAGSSTNQFDRYAANAPASSTFIRVTLRSTIGVETVAYDIYPGKDLAGNYDLARNWDYVYTTTFDKSGSQLSSDRRVAVEGTPIDLTTIPSNCYILAPGKSYKFDPRIKGEGQNVTGGVSLPVRHDVDEVRLVWQDAPSLVKSFGLSSDRTVAVVSLNPDVEGNAVVAACNGGRPVWSWHLWVRSKGVAWYTSNGVSGMGCVLGAFNFDNDDFGGAASLGLLYQWGRPTPFPGPASVNSNIPKPVYDLDNHPVVFDTSAGAAPISTVVEHPVTFYYAGTPGTSWHTDGADLWGGTSGSKTIFDPCPRGWKIVPDKTMWGNWVANTSSLTRFVWDPVNLGRLSFENGVHRGFYPAVGFYTNSPGSEPALVNVGYEGRYWSAIFSGGQGGILRFTAKVSGSTAPDNDVVERTMIDQAYGCSVRPVRY